MIEKGKLTFLRAVFILPTEISTTGIGTATPLVPHGGGAA
jgi:hypothetical protein